jgi:hypothetical protein
MPKTIPTNGQTNWGTALNDHLKQLNDPTIGGFNIVVDDAARDAKYTGLTINDIGLTVFNRKVNQFQVWTSNPVSPSNGMWMDLNGTAEKGAKPGQGVVNLRTDGYLEILNVPNGTAVDIRQLGINIGTTITANNEKIIVNYISSDGKKFHNDSKVLNYMVYTGFASKAQRLNPVAQVESRVGENILRAVGSTNFSTMNLQVGDYIWPNDPYVPGASGTLAHGVIKNITNTQIEVSNMSRFQSNYTSPSIFIQKRSDSTNLNYTQADTLFSSASSDGSNKPLYISSDNILTNKSRSNLSGVSSVTSRGEIAFDGTSNYNGSTDDPNIRFIISNFMGTSAINVPSATPFGSASLWVRSALNNCEISSEIMGIYVDLASSVQSSIAIYKGVSVGSGALGSTLNIDKYYPFYERGTTYGTGTIKMNYFSSPIALGGSDGVQAKTNLSVRGLPVHADNTAAIAAGLNNGDFYRKADGTVMVRF